MAFEKLWTSLILFLILIVMHNGEQVGKRLNLRKFGVTFGLDDPIEESYSPLLKKFEKNLLLDQKLKHEQELEKKRNEIFQKYLLSRVSGSILKDFYRSAF